MAVGSRNGGGVSAKHLFICMLLHAAKNADGFSTLSSFTQSPTAANTVNAQRWHTNGRTLTMYGDHGSTEDFNAWTVLSTTEKWIASTLSSLNSSTPSPSGKTAFNRKEISYACESYNDTPMIAAGIFRRVKELRQVGEEHGHEQQEDMERLSERQREDYNPPTIRQTQVVVIPRAQSLTEQFDPFNSLIERINTARRHARDYVTDIMLDKIDDDTTGVGGDLDWSISVSCAHMHPRFGERTPEQELEDLQREEEEGEVDLNYKAYQERKKKARQSPYPTIVLEMRATPAIDFSTSPDDADHPLSDSPPPSSSLSSESSQSSSDSTDGVTSEDVQKLEALFGKSAALESKDCIDNSKEAEDGASEAIKQKKDSLHQRLSDTLEEVSALTPIQWAQHWMSTHDPKLFATNENVVASFTDTSTAHIDAAYEFVFVNLAMLLASESACEEGTTMVRQYLVMPHFLSCAATSLEKFKEQVEMIWEGWPELQSREVSLEVFHPEHIDVDRRSPMPVLVIELAL